MALKPAKEIQRVYDQAIKSWLSGLRVDYGTDPTLGARPNQPIFTVFSSPERAYASMATMLRAEGLLPLDVNPYSTVSDEGLYKQFIYPFARVQYVGAAPGIDLARNPVTLRMFDSSGTSYIQRPAPFPIEMSYSVEFVAKTRLTMNYLLAWVYGQFGRRGAGATEFFIMAEHPEPWGKMLAPVMVTAVTDTSILEAEGSDDREVRCTIDLNVRGWQVDTSENGLGRVPAVYFPRAEIRTMEDSDALLRRFGTLLAQTPTPQLSLGLDRSAPVDFANSTASPLLPAVDDLIAFKVASPGQTVQTVRVPAPAGTGMSGAVRVKAVRNDTGAGQPLLFRVCWRDRTSGAVTVRQEWTVNATPVAWTGVPFDTVVPANTDFFVAVTTPAGAPEATVALGRFLLGAQDTSGNQAAALDRTKGPGLVGTQNDVTATTVASVPHLISVPVSASSQAKTVAIFDNSAGTGVPVLQVTVPAGTAREVLVRAVPSSASSGFLARVTSAAVDATLVIGPVAVFPCAPSPAFV